MPQIINDPGRAALFGQALGTGLGAGVGQGVDTILRNKLNQLSQQQEDLKFAQALKGLGYSPEESAFIKAIPDKFKWEAALALRGSTPQAQQVQQLPVGLQELLTTQEAPSAQEASPAMTVYTKMSPQQMQQEAITSGRIKPLTTEQYLNQLLASQVPPQQAPEVKRPKGALTPPEPLARREPLSQQVTPQVAQDKFPGYKTKEERAMAHREKLAQTKEQARERSERFKITQQERKDLAERAKSAKNVLEDLNRFEELEKEGKLDTPGYVEFLERSGLDIPALMNPGSEEFNKIANNFVRDAKNYYGGRVSNFEVEQFLKTVPSLSQSPEGRKRVIANLRRLNQGAVEYFNTAREITKENDGVPPYDLAEQVEERMEDKSKKLADRFKEDLKKPVPKGQNKLITALQATGGSILGKVLKSGAKAGPFGHVADIAGLLAA